MKAFHNDPGIKNKYLDRVIAHQKADNLIRGTGWEHGKGCAVGCTLERYNHAAYETELGIPEWLAKVEDTLFENMSFEKSKTWPEEFLKAINTGADLEKVKTPFIVMLLKHTLVSMKNAKYDEIAWPRVKAAIQQSTDAVQEMIRCHENGLDLSAAWSAAELAARSAAWSAAWSAARSAAWSAAWSAARSAEAAAESAARSAGLAGSAAWSEAEPASGSVRKSTWSAARSAKSAVWSATFDYYADQLLEIMRCLEGGMEND